MTLNSHQLSHTLSWIDDIRIHATGPIATPIIQRALRDEITNLQRSIAAITAYYNTFSVAGRLPAEVLIHIFKYCTLETCPRLDQVKRTPPVLCRCSGQICVGHPWLKVTHVCNHWRSVALNDPSLWTCIKDVYSGSCLTTMASRSMSMPLSISATSYESQDLGIPSITNALANVLSNHWDQVCDLDLTLSLTSTLVHQLRKPSETMSSLRLAFYKRCRLDLKQAPLGPLLGGTAPSIRHFRLQGRGCSVPLRDLHGMFPNIERLELFNITPYLSTADDFALVLSTMPRLECIVFEKNMHDYGYPEHVIHHDIPGIRTLAPTLLSNLTVLVLAPFGFENCLAFLDSCKLPAMEVIRISLDLGGEHEPDISSSVRSFMMSLGGCLMVPLTEVNPFPSLVLGTSKLSTDDSLFSFLHWKSSRPRPPKSTNSTIQPNFNNSALLEFDVTFITCDSYWMSFPMVLPIQNVDNLELHLHDYHPEIAVTEISRWLLDAHILRQLTVQILYPKDMFTIFEVLSTTSRPSFAPVAHWQSEQIPSAGTILESDTVYPRIDTITLIFLNSDFYYSVHNTEITPHFEAMFRFVEDGIRRYGIWPNLRFLRIDLGQVVRDEAGWSGAEWRQSLRALSEKVFNMTGHPGSFEVIVEV